MKAKEIERQSKDIKEIYEQIERDNSSGWFKSFFPHFVNISNETKIQLIQDGFKVYEGEWLRGDYGLIIEW